VLKAACVKAIRVEGGADMARSRIDALTEQVKLWGAKGLAWTKVVSATEVEQGIAKLLSDDEVRQIISRTDAQPGDMLFFSADTREKVRHVLGLLRLELGRPPVTEGGLQFHWIVDFPLFEGVDEETGQPIPAHHAFTMPHLDDIDKLESDPLSVRSQSYDLVCNGWELGSGSIRIHRPDVQQRIFDVLGISAEEQQSRFGFLLNAFEYGPPPHGGFAVGVDRLIALLVGEENIREVIAFPKTQTGTDPLTDSPSEVDPKQLRELGIQVLPKNPPKKA
jgi:aspartyl-tRNA synthetase